MLNNVMEDFLVGPLQSAVQSGKVRELADELVFFGRIPIREMSGVDQFRPVGEEFIAPAVVDRFMDIDGGLINLRKTAESEIAEIRCGNRCGERPWPAADQPVFLDEGK